MDDQNPQILNPNPPAANNPRQQIIERMKQANNVLVTVSNNPSVDQLAACIGLTLILNKLNKHATAVFSGQVPSTLEFLQPEQTLEKTTDSLRDFIISLDKSKADKLRYKVEDKVVKIFITPYRTSISEKDLEFSQGDFNVDVVVALGVHEQKDLDQAITAHGRILHDAAVTTISTSVPSTLGSVNWQDADASSLSELITSISEELGPKLMDSQIATALLTGIVAETQRFSNEKTSPRTMSASATLMSAGANQQLVATKLEPPPPPPEPTEPSGLPPTGPRPPEPPARPPKDTLEVPHDDEEPATPPESPAALAEKIDKARAQQQIHIDEEGRLHVLSDNKPPQPPAGPAEQPATSVGSQRTTMQNEPTFNGTLTSEAKPEPYDPTSDALSLPKVEQPILSHDGSSGMPTSTPPTFTPPPEPDANETLDEIEKQVDSPHANEVDDTEPGSPPSPPDIESLSEAAKEAAASSEPLPTPEAFNSQYAVDDLHANDSQPDPTLAPMPAPEPAVAPPAAQPAPIEVPANPFPANLVPSIPPPAQPMTDAPTDSPAPPPPVPPPLPPTMTLPQA
jgi:hypothetical protein